MLIKRTSGVGKKEESGCDVCMTLREEFHVTNKIYYPLSFISNAFSSVAVPALEAMVSSFEQTLFL